MAKRSVQEYLGLPASWPVREKIKHEIVLMPNAADLKKADKKNPQGCVLHNTACRVFGVPNCAIGGRYAYIPQRDAKGRSYIAHVYATEATQKAIRAFDRTGKMPQGGFRFTPLSESQLTKVKRKYHQTYNKIRPAKGEGRKYTAPKKRQTALRRIPSSVSAA